MSYSVNPNLFKSIFAVPSDIVDKHIRLANGDQLKVLLWILRNNTDSPEIAELCKALKINESDAEDYLQYWVLTGVLNSSDEPTHAHKEIAEEIAVIREKKTEKTVKNDVPATPSKPSSAEIAKRIDESPEIGHLMLEAQQMLGKTIGYDGQCTLLLLHDHYGLPTEVLFMMIDYCVSVGKTNYSYIEAVGKDWGLREIDTMDKAAEQITALRNANSVWKDLAMHAGINNTRPTTKQSEYIRRWSNELKFSTDMIILAYEEMANHTGKFSMSYMEKVLLNWHSKGYKKPDDVEKAAEENKKSASKTVKNADEASYDLDKFRQQSLHGELKYERKKKG